MTNQSQQPNINKNLTLEKAWFEYQKQLLSFIQYRVNSPEDAEDIVNDVFTQLAIKSEKNDLPRNISPWLYQVTKNKIIDYYRAKKPFTELPDNILFEEKETTVTEEFSKCVLPMIKTLPLIYQQPLAMSEIEGKKYAYVADRLGLTIPAVKSRILRGRKKLQENLLRCCTINKDQSGNIIDYQKKNNDSCRNC